MFIFQNSNKTFYDELTLWRGISREDIDTRSPLFYTYIGAFCKNGSVEALE